MILLSLKNKNQLIELLVNNEFDIKLITEYGEELFQLKSLIEKAFSDLDRDYDFSPHDKMVEVFKSAGAIGFPLTPAMDARLYAKDRKKTIDLELEIEI